MKEKTQKTEEDILELLERNRYASEKWRLLNPEEAKEKSDANKDYRREYSKNYYEIHREEIKRKKEEWIKANPESYKMFCKKYTQTYYQKHKETIKQKSLNYYYNKNK